ncbi:ABC transporter ATP-binding protein [Kineosporia babensis]|uniref:ATP-binding cassette domain-containing protein n=1 Tax=Kineosporia babensis TaxID=499548 RepID=A0A9X1T1Y9_9ACTN|nr:ATP-binding cassette domain-containing protein [Kineosporia babensis]MCD5314098.1 ATP-binding cassette domain-containing protein [Kineosporia babensis]
MSAPLLQIKNLMVDAPGRRWRQPHHRILHGVDLSVGQGQTVGLVGESGSGKTTIGRVVLGLFPHTSGEVRFDGQPMPARRERGAQVQAVFQDPYSSLNPAMTIGDILTEPLLAARWSRTDAQARISELLDRVAMPAGTLRRYPREFSGGQRQRIAIARALAREPRLIVCDEPVSALDLSTQARVLDLLIEVQRDTGVALLFISHDLAVVRRISHRIAVIQSGRIVEEGEVEQVADDPTHDYTRRLMTASPLPDPDRQAERRAAWLELTRTTKE